MAKRKQRQQEKAFYDHTRQNANAPIQRPTEIKKGQSGATPRWHYQVPTYGGTAFITVAVIAILQYFAMVIATSGAKPDRPYFSDFGMTIPYLLLIFIGAPILCFFLYKKFHATWYNNNAMWLSDDIREYENDTYIRTMDHLFQELEIAPDAGLGFDGHVSTIMGHAMMSNKGIKKIEIPVYDENVPGQVARDENGNIIYHKVEMFDKELGNLLYDMSGVPQKSREWFDATDYAFNPIIPRKEGGDGKRRAGAYGRKEYNKVSDYINSEFYPLDTETARPAGVYFYDSRPVNTILIAITRGGKETI